MTQAEYDAVAPAMSRLERLPIDHGPRDARVPADRGADRVDDSGDARVAGARGDRPPPQALALQRHQETQHASGDLAGLHELAKDHGLAVLALMRRGAAVKGGTARVPRMEDLKESGDLEDNADGVVILHNEGRYPTKKYAEGQGPRATS